MKPRVFGMKKMDENLTASCGLCCADCIPSREEFFALVDRLDQMLGELQFEQYAEFKSARHEEFEDYPSFLSVLRQIKGLRCPVPCQQGGGIPRCEVRQCVKLPANRAGLPGNEISFLIVPLDPAYKAGLTGHLPVQTKGLKGCWECEDRRRCTLLDGLRRVHPNLDYHLDLIAAMGPAQWFEKRKEHYRWQCKGDAEQGDPAAADKPRR
jgi:hypothetical protein